MYTLHVDLNPSHDDEYATTGMMGSAATDCGLFLEASPSITRPIIMHAEHMERQTRSAYNLRHRVIEEGKDVTIYCLYSSQILPLGR